MFAAASFYDSFVSPQPDAASAVPVEERLFSLVLALLASRSGLTKHEILATVQGYRQRYRTGEANASLERQFERDKDDIRELGVPLETIDDPGDPGNNQSLRYRIPKGEYDLPPDVEFSARELMLLGLAGMVWSEGALSDESRRATLKLRSGSAHAEAPVLGYSPRVRHRDAAFEPVNTALERGQLISFDYLKPGQVRHSARTVIPLALVQFDGRWHLYAEDEPSGAPRTFLLRRIVGAVTPGAAAPTRPGDHTAVALAELAALWEANVAELAVTEGTDAAARLRNRRGTEQLAPNRLRIHYVDPLILADELAGFGPEVLVIAPEQLRTAVRARLAEVVASHG